jgi:hypothetical protein
MQGPQPEISAMAIGKDPLMSLVYGNYVARSLLILQAIWIWGGALIDPWSKQALLSCYVMSEEGLMSWHFTLHIGLCFPGWNGISGGVASPYKSWRFIASLKLHVGPRPNPPIIEKPCLTMAPIICHRNTTSECKLCISYSYRMNNNKRISTLGCKDANNST